MQISYLSCCYTLKMEGICSLDMSLDSHLPNDITAKKMSFLGHGGRTDISETIRFEVYYSDMVSRDSAVGIATDYGLDDCEVGVRVPVG
jgi:hypothetical protein